MCLGRADSGRVLLGLGNTSLASLHEIFMVNPHCGARWRWWMVVVVVISLFLSQQPSPPPLLLATCLLGEIDFDPLICHLNCGVYHPTQPPHMCSAHSDRWPTCDQHWGETLKREGGGQASVDGGEHAAHDIVPSSH